MFSTICSYASFSSFHVYSWQYFYCFNSPNYIAVIFNFLFILSVSLHRLPTIYSLPNPTTTLFHQIIYSHSSLSSFFSYVSPNKFLFLLLFYFLISRLLRFVHLLHLFFFSQQLLLFSYSTPFFVLQMIFFVLFILLPLLLLPFLFVIVYLLFHLSLRLDVSNFENH